MSYFSTINELTNGITSYPNGSHVRFFGRVLHHDLKDQCLIVEELEELFVEAELVEDPTCCEAHEIRSPGEFKDSNPRRSEVTPNLKTPSTLSDTINTPNGSIQDSLSHQNDTHTLHSDDILVPGTFIQQQDEPRPRHLPLVRVYLCTKDKYGHVQTVPYSVLKNCRTLVENNLIADITGRILGVELLVMEETEKETQASKAAPQQPKNILGNMSKPRVQIGDELVPPPIDQSSQISSQEIPNDRNAQEEHVFPAVMILLHEINVLDDQNLLDNPETVVTIIHKAIVAKELAIQQVLRLEQQQELSTPSQ